MGEFRQLATPPRDFRSIEVGSPVEAVVERRTIHIHDLAAEDIEFPEGSQTRDATATGPRWQVHYYAKENRSEQF